MSVIKEIVCSGEAGCQAEAIWELSALSAQLFCKCKNAIKNKVYKFRKQYTTQTYGEKKE